MAGVPTVLIARTDAHSANLLTSDVDDADKPFCTGKRTPEGFYYVNCGVKVPAGGRRVAAQGSGAGCVVGQGATMPSNSGGWR